MREDELFAAYGEGVVVDQPKAVKSERLTVSKFPNDDAFWAQVKPDFSCWLWTGAVTRDGYGYLYVGAQKLYAHRRVFTVMGEPLDHHDIVRWFCGTRNCVRPEHLYSVRKGDPRVLTASRMSARGEEYRRRRVEAIHNAIPYSSTVAEEVVHSFEALIPSVTRTPSTFQAVPYEYDGGKRENDAEKKTT